jgi:glycosyltransferase involved in cell wall biosynthesis
MNILLYSEFFYPIPGGTQSFVLELARGLVQPPAANSVTLVTQTPAQPRASSPADASSVPVAADAYPFSVVRRPGLRAFWKFLRRADLVHVAGPAMLPMALSVLARKRFVVEHHGCQVACPNGLLFFEPTQSPCPGHYMARRYAKCIACNRKSVGLAMSLRMLLLTPIRRWLANRAGRNIMPTAWLVGVLRLNRATTIHHGVASPARASSPLPPANAVGAITFAFQGRLVSTKGIATLLAATEQLHTEGRAFRLKILGDGPELSAAKSRAAGL